ncbi:Hsp20 family protein [Simiduia aestuariiviva]|uniref:Molecular chaperone IbpA n=1 Tax=Simiduia aestuariiviva TaxID=1510459 RepID=A0A839UJ07_9GAMM|nr:Hsp20 family protein [Simiduia aestuariiviva]MBB3168074.1 molecular chaperone IbpA [Simiduia aestuariiviva]
MRNFDLTPFYRSTIGFDRLASVLDSLSQAESNQSSYPPYNIELLGEDAYRITMAVAGFAESEIEIKVDQGKLTVVGKKSVEKSNGQYLHQGIAERNFERRFQLADYVKVEGASLDNGLLYIELVRELPDAMKPRTIAINGQKKHSLHAA